MQDHGWHESTWKAVVSQQTDCKILGHQTIHFTVRVIVPAVLAVFPEVTFTSNRLRSGIGAMIAVLGGIDALVFTAGIGENSPEVRAAVCEDFAFLDLRLDQVKNAESSLDEDISALDATVRILVIHAQEDWMIARECWNLVRTATTSMGH